MHAESILSIRVFSILLCLPPFLHCQSKGQEIDLDELRKETLDLMRELEIPVRPNHTKDGPITLTFYDEYGFNGSWKPNDPVYNLNRVDMYYSGSVLKLTNSIRKVIQEGEEESPYWFYRAKGTIIHELVHSLAVRDFSKYIQLKPDRSNFQEYVNQPDEVDAYSAYALYFLKNYAPHHVGSAMKEASPQQRKTRLLNLMAEYEKQKPTSFPDKVN